MTSPIPARDLARLFLFLLLCLLPLAASAAPAERLFAANGEGDAYYRKMRTEMAGMVRLTVKGTNVRVRDGAGTSFPISEVAQPGAVYYAKKVAVKGADGLMWHEITGALASQTDSSAFRMDPCFICADFVQASPLTRPGKSFLGDSDFIERAFYEVYPAETLAFTLDRDTPFEPEPDCPLVTDPERNVLPAGLRLIYGFPSGMGQGSPAITVHLALPDKRQITIGKVRLADFDRLDLGKDGPAIRRALDESLRLAGAR